MKTKDLLYVGAIGVLAYLLYKNKNKAIDSTTPQDLNQPDHMDLPNLTPSTGVPIEVALGGLKSDCSDTFTVPSTDGSGNTTLYSTLNGLKYKQLQGLGIKGVKIQIPQEEFNKACADYKLTFGGIKQALVEPMTKLKDSMVNFSGTLYRGVM